LLPLLLTLHPRQANIMKTPDIGVEASGIAGGQRSILDKELREVKQGHLIPRVDIEVANVRAEGGKVCQVTPVADTYAREAMRRLRGGRADRNFVPGYTGILVGEGGLVKEPVCPVKQQRALFERAQQLALELVAAGEITGAAAVEVTGESKLLHDIVAAMQGLAEPTKLEQRIKEVDSRVKQLEIIQGQPVNLDSLDRKFARYALENAGRVAEEWARTEGEHAGPPPAFCANTAEKLVELKKQLKGLRKALKEASATIATGVGASQVQYEELLRGSGESPLLAGIQSAVEGADAFVASGEISAAAFARVVGRAGFLTCPQTDLLPPAMGVARQAIRDLEAQETLGLLEGLGEDPSPEKAALFDDLSILYACYNKAAIPDLYVNFLRNYRENKDFWPPVYSEHTRPALIKVPRPAYAAVDKTEMHWEVEDRVGAAALKAMVALQKEIDFVEDRVHSQEQSSALFDAEELAEPFAFKRRLAPETVAALAAKVPALKAELDGKKASVGLSVDYQYLVDDLIGNALAQ
jgi:hypothetical protein